MAEAIQAGWRVVARVAAGLTLIGLGLALGVVGWGLLLAGLGGAPAPAPLAPWALWGF